MIQILCVWGIEERASSQLPLPLSLSLSHSHSHSHPLPLSFLRASPLPRHDPQVRKGREEQLSYDGYDEILIWTTSSTSALRATSTSTAGEARCTGGIGDERGRGEGGGRGWRHLKSRRASKAQPQLWVLSRPGLPSFGASLGSLLLNLLRHLPPFPPSPKASCSSRIKVKEGWSMS